MPVISSHSDTTMIMRRKDEKEVAEALLQMGGWSTIKEPASRKSVITDTRSALTEMRRTDSYYAHTFKPIDVPRRLRTMSDAALIVPQPTKGQVLPLPLVVRDRHHFNQAPSPLSLVISKSSFPPPGETSILDSKYSQQSVPSSLSSVGRTEVLLKTAVPKTTAEEHEKKDSKPTMFELDDPFSIRRHSIGNVFQFRDSPQGVHPGTSLPIPLFQAMSRATFIQLPSNYNGAGPVAVTIAPQALNLSTTSSFLPPQGTALNFPSTTGILLSNNNRDVVHTSKEELLRKKQQKKVERKGFRARGLISTEPRDIEVDGFVIRREQWAKAFLQSDICHSAGILFKALFTPEEIQKCTLRGRNGTSLLNLQKRSAIFRAVGWMRNKCQDPYSFDSNAPVLETQQLSQEEKMIIEKKVYVERRYQTSRRIRDNPKSKRQSSESSQVVPQGLLQNFKSEGIEDIIVKPEPIDAEYYESDYSEAVSYTNEDAFARKDLKQMDNLNALNDKCASDHHHPSDNNDLDSIISEISYGYDPPLPKKMKVEVSG